MKKWYIASRTRHRELVNKLIEIIEHHGDRISYKWSVFGSLAPYHEHQIECQKIARDIHNAIVETDVFVLISDKEGTDMFVELGLALQKEDSRRVYIVGKYNQRSLMQFHPSIIHVDSFEFFFIF